MVTMVEMIEQTKNNIEELKGLAKENAKKITALMQEKDDIFKNLKMFERVLDDLTRTKEEEIQVEMNDKVSEENHNEVVHYETESKLVIEKKKKRRKTRKPSAALMNGNNKGKPISVYAIDQNDEKIAEYKSYTEAGKDLGISSCTVKWRIDNVSKERQIEKNGYALILA